jgi:small redox-active disulfide protein 2
MRIEIFGPGCAKCRKTSAEIEKVVNQLGIDATIEHVTDMDAIVNRGVLLTPAVFIDGEKKTEGKVPKASDIEAWLRT